MSIVKHSCLALALSLTSALGCADRPEDVAKERAARIQEILREEIKSAVGNITLDSKGTVSLHTLQTTIHISYQGAADTWFMIEKTHNLPGGDSLFTIIHCTREDLLPTLQEILHHQ